ncbi:hypothetical protein BH23BAC3_BH23BAC3_11650 [soil metagenome]
MPNKHNIFITRELSDDQISLAESLGLNVVAESALTIEFRNDWMSVQSAVERSENVAFAFTSQNGVKGFHQFKSAGVNFPEKSPVYAVGKKTAEALREIGIENIKSPDKQDGTGLAHLIIDDFLKTPELKNADVLHFCGDRRRDELRHFLTDSNIRVKDIVVYKTNLNQMNMPGTDFDATLFFSPSAVQAFRQSGGFNTSSLPELFAIGPTTAEELSIESGRHVHISPEPNTEIFLKFVARILNERNMEPIKERPPSKGARGDDSNLYYNKRLKLLARQLRNNSTKSEIRLWTELLRGKKTGYTFLRQRPVLNYISDFLCKDLKLIIELDGYSHDFEQQWKKDKQKQHELEDAGFKILRFSDDLVMNDLRYVESEIMYWIDKLEPGEGQNPSPPLKGESAEGTVG